MRLKTLYQPYVLKIEVKNASQKGKPLLRCAHERDD